MRLQVVRPWLGLVAVVCCACNPATRPATHVITAPSVLQPLPPPPETPELSAVPDPPALVAVARLRNPEATFKAALQLAKMPGPSLTALLSLLGDTDRTGLIRLDSSLDVAMLVDPDSPKDEPKYLAAVSIPLRDLQSSRGVLSSFHPIAPGVSRGTLESQFGGTGRPTVCDLAASAGDAPARLVCSDSEREVDALRPWLTRTLSRARPAPADVRLEIRARPFQQSYETEIALGIDELSHSAARFLERELKVQEPELLEAPGVVLRETAAFFNDIDTLRFDVSIDGPGETASLSGTLAFRTTHGWYTRLLTHRNDRSGPPPAVFWRLPRDCETAVHSRGVDPSYYEGIYRVLRLAANRLMTPNGVSERSRAAVDEFLGAMPSPDVVSATASGALAPSSQVTVKTPADSVKAFKSLASSVLGWSLSGIEAPPASYVAWLKKGGTAVELLLADLRKQLPAKDRAWVPTAKVNPAPAGLPKGSIALDLTWNFDSKTSWPLTAETGIDHPAGAAAKGQLAFRLVVVPDGANRTWFGFASDSAALQKRIAAVLTGAPETGTLGARQDLEALRREPALYSGFVSYGAAVERSFGMSKKLGSGEVEWLRSAILAAPNKLQTPILLRGTGTTGPAPENTLEMRLQRGSIEDLVVLLQYVLKHPPPPTSLPTP